VLGVGLVPGKRLPESPVARIVGTGKIAGMSEQAPLNMSKSDSSLVSR
jgi:hypothetical protein